MSVRILIDFSEQERRWRLSNEPWAKGWRAVVWAVEAPTIFDAGRIAARGCQWMIHDGLWRDYAVQQPEELERGHWLVCVRYRPGREQAAKR